MTLKEVEEEIYRLTVEGEKQLLLVQARYQGAIASWQAKRKELENQQNQENDSVVEDPS
jgi:hypothetical protein